MHTLKYYTLSLLSAAALLWGVGSCEERDVTGCPACPVVTSITPNTARAFETITVNGRNFGGFKPTLDAVTIDGVKLLPVNTDQFTDTQMQFIIPEALANGKKDPLLVSVKIGNLTSDEGEGSSLQYFTYAYPEITQMLPNHGRVGDIIVIKGKNFDPIASNNIIKFGEIPAEVMEATEEQLEVIVPENVLTGKIFLEINGFTLEGPVFSYNTVVVTALVPDNGRKGEIITIKGLFFDKVAENNHVQFFEELEAEVIKANDTLLQVVVPEGAKTGPVKVEVDGFTAADKPVFTYNTVQITALVPDNGVAGNIITIKGQYFDTTATKNVVKFGELTAEVKAVTDSTLQVVIPAGAKSGLVTVRADGFTAEKKLAFTYNSAQVTALVPDNGRKGETITIKGRFFSPEAAKNEVKFGELTAEVTAATDSTLKVIIPEGADTGPVTVKVDGTTAENKPTFTYNGVVVTALAPDNGREGETIMIKGKYFDTTPAENTVTFGGLSAEVKAATDSTLQVVIPEGAQSGMVTVAVEGRIAANQPKFTYNTVEVTTISPAAAGLGKTITIAGKFFGSEPPANVVRINGMEAEVIAVTPIALQVKVPKGAGSGKVTVEVDGRVAVNQPDFTYVLTPVLSTIAKDHAFLFRVDNLTVSPDGILYATENYSRIIKIDPVTEQVSPIAGGTLTGFANGTGEEAKFYIPDGIALDEFGNMYIGDYYNNLVRKVTKEGVVTTLAGSYMEGEGSFEDNTNPFFVKFNGPQDIVFDNDRNLLLVDSRNLRIRKLTLAGETTTFVHFNNEIYPNGMVVAPNGMLYFSGYDEKIYQITPAGEVSTLAGTGEQGSRNGKASQATFNGPTDIALGPDGNLYVTDMNNNQIRKIDITSGGEPTVTTIAGTGSTGDSDEGLGEFARPSSLDFDTEGNLYITDFDNVSIRKISFE